MIAINDLNGNQRCAADWNDGPLLVLAGPGSGKTMVLTLRVARLLKENEHSAVLALTFTNKAAAEMRERVNQLLDRYTDRAHLCTFHKFAAEILRQHGSHLGLRPDFGLLTTSEDRIAFLEDVVRSPEFRNLDLPPDPQNLLRLLDRQFSQSQSNRPPAASLQRQASWLPLLLEHYCTALVRANRLDFGSLLYFASRLLREKPAVARVVRLSWTHICVDEFQDTNRAQFELLRLVAPTKGHNLFVVADEDQIIYQWNGACVQRLSELSKAYDIKTVQLPESYRCPPEIVYHANRLIGRNASRVANKRLVSLLAQRPYCPDAVRYLAFNSIADETRFVAKDIQARGLSVADCVVLGRTNNLLWQAAEGLQDAGQKAHVPQSKSDFDSPLLGVLVASLKLANSRHDRIVLRKICRQWHSLTGEIIDPNEIEAESTLIGGDFLRAWLGAADAASGQDHGQLLRLIRTNLVDRLVFPKVVAQFLDGDWRSFDESDHEELVSEEIETWRALHQNIIAEHGGSVTLNTYLHSLDLSSKAPLAGPDTLQCMTVHRSKGLQFKHVYLIGMAQDVFPSFRAVRVEELEEERRSCFVAITRTRCTLTLTGARQYFGYPKEPSQFLEELGLFARHLQASRNKPQ